MLRLLAFSSLALLKSKLILLLITSLKDGMKKKRSRRASKDKDAKSGVKKKRKKKNQDKMDEELGADGSHSVAGMIGLQISQSSPAGKNIGPWKQVRD